ncbi:MAG: molybdopterin-binding protein [Hyphomicrobiales bacterium]
MKFGEVDVSQAKDALVAHAIVLPGRRLKKGHIITQQDMAELQQAGIDRLTVARLEPEDVEENEAATRIAGALCTAHLSPAEAFTGRVNIYADSSGIFQADRELVDRLNRISPSITFASLNDGEFVETGRMVATVKIIPFAVEEGLIEKAIGVINEGAMVDLVGSRSLKVGLVATQLPSLKPSTMDKTKRILGDRLAPTGSVIVAEQRVEHTEEAVASALRELEDHCDLLIIFGASAITDRADVLPQGIEKSGGEVTYFGMPVDPGNLLLIGTLNGKTVIGAPGCARSPAENGFDWVLQRVICDLPVDEDYITGLGVGGLLMEISARPQPREG